MFIIDVATKNEEKNGDHYTYEGVVDKNNKMCGLGQLKINEKIVYTGTFYNDQRNGIGKLLVHITKE